MPAGSGLTRRHFLGDAAMVGAAALAPAPLRRRRSRRTVVVLGGGVGGLTAAHELAVRGFHVTVYEPRALGGKARSIPVRGTGVGGRRDLPGEHGFRFFPGFYQHLPDTMRRIPFGANPRGVYDNLVIAAEASFARTGGRTDLLVSTAPRSGSLEDLQQSLKDAYAKVDMAEDELAFFIRRLSAFFTSSDERRFGEWERTSWWDFVAAERHSEEYRRLLAIGVTRNLVAAKAEVASTRTIGSVIEAFLYATLNRGRDGAPDRVLNGPTNEVWIDAWVARLRELGVRFRLGWGVEALELRGGRVSAARLRNGRRTADADWYVCALPVERARRLWSPEIRAADPRLARMSRLRTDWMNGIQFYLDRPAPIVHGHVTYLDSPWALTSVSQQQFWPRHDLAAGYGDGRVRDCLSVDISDWERPGILYGKPGTRLTARQIADEVWAQMKAHLNDPTTEVLSDAMLESWFLDPALSFPPPRDGRRRVENAEPLLINTVGSWRNRPPAATAIPNLVLAADYVRTSVDLATMEGADEAARHAVNAFLRRSGSHADPARLYRLYRAPELADLRRDDARRYARGQPNALDVPPG